MKVTARSTVSTLGVILGVCAAPLAAVAQGLPSGAPPTAGFADPTPEEQRVLRGNEPAGGGSSTAVAPYAAATPRPAAVASPPAAYSPAPARAYAFGGPAYASAVAPRYTYTAPPQYAYSAPPTSASGGYQYASGTEPGTGDARSDVGGGGGTKEKSQKAEHFRIGVLGGVGFPRALALEGMIKLEKVLGLGLEYSTTPGFSISGVDTSFWAIAATVRVFPFKDGFFLGLRGGRQHMGGEATVTVARYGTFHETATMDTTFLNPRIGFLWTWSPGLTLGIDAGVQIPLGVTVATSLPAGTGVDQEVIDVAQAIGNSPLPTIDLLKVGFLL